MKNGIRKKFNQTSDILDKFDWSEEGLDPEVKDIQRYFFYTMLYREFEYLKEFDKLDNGEFGSKYEDIKYFGIDSETEDEVGNQIDVLYYNSEDDFAIIINTKNDDEVIFCKNSEGETFNEIYENMNKKSGEYKGSKIFLKRDLFKAPYLNFNVIREYDELAEKLFYTKEGDEAMIQKAMQSIQFEIDEKGGRVKSEAAIDMNVMTTSIEMPSEPRYFYIDDTFTIFLREKGKELPYFAANVDDITKFQ